MTLRARTKDIVVENSRPSPPAFNRASNADRGGTGSGSALRRRDGR
jgi:hypothetical protein